MSGLLKAVLAAHGGVDRWRKFSFMEVTIVSGGKLWAIKGQPQDPSPRRMTIALHREWASIRPFGATDQKTDFTPERIAIEKLDGRVVAERSNPRDSFNGHSLTTPWDPLQRAYFNGYALWTYLTTPFFMTLPDFAVNEIDPVEHDDERWSGLEVHFPAQFASHSSKQEFYFGDDHLLRRHDYRVDVAGGFAAIQYLYDMVEADGIKVPSKRRAYRCDADGQPMPDELMVSIDVSDIQLS
ncbi:hypothetical protein BN1232_01738 [Mycobacterium lentiflavum]|uniref:Uncharacterized protein n=1 Tax=Mycobacterium lentiflavum TaxID=141349 RepID=A0A0E4CMD1_MYCLN|nr:hypothetical protein [Mycobacterium lentiflavum]MEE3067689.1 hypothetical protein [Actinomycetota bacterium]ULP43822.1 hypothetical protein MJO58_07660 [Mycobacterium lentiflavum]CQD09541.1 hypothetical protein BN1232_01738 [Mycobacterium lentiflavum]